MIERTDTDGTYLGGPLKGQTAVTVLIDARSTTWLKKASAETGYSIERLVQISAEEAALNYARDNNLIGRGIDT